VRSNFDLLVFSVLMACGDKSDETIDIPIPLFETDSGIDDTDTNDEDPIDADSDGYFDNEDCNDEDDAIHPGAEEVCDGIDNNCDDAVDEDLLRTYYPDADLDGYGDTQSPIEACSRPDGYIIRGEDCDDSNPEVYPGAVEYCNGVDDNCDDEMDGLDAVDPSVWYADSDNDGFGNPSLSVTACDPPAGFVENALDCEDFDPHVSPFALEMCDGEDNDCNGIIDEDTAVDASEWYRDADGDGWGSELMTTVSCSMPGGFTDNTEDCDDGSALISPSGVEVCNGLDDNCDGAVDEGFEVDTYYRDADGDTYGDTTEPIVSCMDVPGYSSTDGDCDDSEYWSNPGLSELCDEIDNDCDGIVDEELVYTDFVPDADGDGFGDSDGPVITDCAPPSGHVIDTTDCDDGNASVNPASVESCNGLDDNCDGTIDEEMPEYTYYEDTDADGFGVPESTVTACALPPGYSESDTDCDDLDGLTYPGAYEFCDGEDDDCNGLIDDDCGYSRNYVLFVTDTFISSSESTWLESRDDADAYCASYAEDNDIDGIDFRIIYSTPDEDARDYLDYVPETDVVYDRYGTLIDDVDLYDGSSPILPDMKSWTIVGSGTDGRFMECSGSYPSGSWPICQYCDTKFACGSSTAALFNPASCCWTGNRAIACMGLMTGD